MNVVDASCSNCNRRIRWLAGAPQLCLPCQSDAEAAKFRIEIAAEPKAADPSRGDA